MIGRITPSGQATYFGFSAPANITGNTDNIAAGPDGNMWFTQDYSGKPSIGRITPSGQVKTFQSGLGADGRVSNLVPGPGGAMWFGELLYVKNSFGWRDRQDRGKRIHNDLQGWN